MLQSPLFWITLVLVPFFVCNLVDRYQLLNSDRTYPDGTVALELNNESLRMTVCWAVWTTLVYTILFIWLDKLRPQEPLVRFLSFGWGARTATWANIYINSWAGQMTQTTSIDADSGTRPAILIAPFVKETAKAIVLFLLAVFHWNRFISRISVVSLVGLPAIGFASVENIIYYAHAVMFAINHIEVGDPEQTVLKLMMLRGVYTSFGYPILTMMTALGIAVAPGACSKWMRVMVPPAGLLPAAGEHMLSNGVPSPSSAGNLKNQQYIVSGFVVAMVLLLVASVMGETHVLRYRFIDLRQGGWLNDQGVIIYSSPFRHIKLHLAGICRDPKVWWRTVKFMRLITELVHTQGQTTRGTVGLGSDDHTHELVYQVEKSHPDAFIDTKGLTVILRRRPQNGATPYPPFPYQSNS